MTDPRSELPDDPDERARHAASLADSPDPAAVAELARLLRDPDPDVRLAAVESLETIGAQDSNKKSGPVLADDCAIALCIALTDDNAHIRWRAAKACGRIGSPEAVFSLMRLLRDENKHVAWSAADALEAIGDVRALEAVEAFKQSRHTQGG